MDGGEHQVEKNRIPKECITVTEPAWIGNTLTGNRTYHVNSFVNNENLKVIRRYSNFEALRNKLIKLYPQCIIPVIPEKSMTEKITSDDGEGIKLRMRGLKRFMNAIKDHPILQ